MTATILRGDARHLPLADGSVDAIVCDPPYGLEFMGREWDSFGRGEAASNAAAGTSAPGIGERAVEWPSYLGGLNPRCRACGRSQRGGSPCRCDAPDFTDERGPRLRAFQTWCGQWATEAYRVLKPGGHMLAFGGSRTWHRLVCAIEDAGFEIRDSMAWLYGSGFPKSLDVSKAIDATAGAQREVVGEGPYAARRPRADHASQGLTYADDAYVRPAGHLLTAPATDGARRWQGWGTALKPGFEPIVVARKPLVGTVAANVLQFGTGALNIDGCRVQMSAADRERIERMGGYGRSGYERNPDTAAHFMQGTPIASASQAHDAGRWPTNVVLSHAPLLDEHGEPIGDACTEGCVPGCPVAELDAQSGVLASGANPTRRGSDKFRDVYGDLKGRAECTPARGADSGGASRFFPTFRYEPKAPDDERPRVNGVAHPTVKPLGLMRWLCRLVTPPHGLVADMFAGSGTTAEAALLEGLNVIVSERDADYLPLIHYRIDRAHRRLQPGVSRLTATKPKPQAEGQGDLLTELLGGAA